MKKVRIVFMILSLGMIGVLPIVAQITNPPEEEEEVDPDPAGGGSECGPGGLANKHCPYWDVEYEYYSGFPPFIPPSITVTCKTGGEFICDE